ncbi:MAG: hypothetical protein WCA07_05910 [Gloeobacterales cyanobacterium]
MSSATNPPDSLLGLEEQLRTLSNSDEAMRLVQEFAASLGKTKARQTVFNALGALVRHPISYREVLAKGLIDSQEDAFSLLQGDVVSTDAAFFLGERLVGLKYVVVNATCDLVPGRRDYVGLLRISPIELNNPNASALLSELLRFKSTRRLYLPRLPQDPVEVLGNAIEFDGIVQVKLSDLLLATRHASLSLVGWRMFGSYVRSIMARAAESEVKIRVAL